MAPNPLSRPATVLVALTLATTAFAAPAVAQGGSADVTLDPQTTGGSTVTVAEATLPQGGFVALHDASLSDGEVLGSVVGSSGHLAAGTHEDVTVHVDKSLTEDATLIAMPHKDSDGDHAYTFVSENGGVDGPYTSGEDIVVDDAELTVSATVSFADQPTDGMHVIVDRIEMSEGGFAAIHDERLLEGMPLASVVGSSGYLSAGVHEDVRVSLDQPRTDEQELIAMPHRDTDGDESYNFVESGGQEDGFYADGNGDPVIDAGTVTPSSTATVTFEAQPTGGTHIHVAETFVPEGGFVTIHDSTLQDGAVLDSVRGVSACLDPGTHRGLSISLDDPLSSDDTLIAMPHRDTNANCNYDFVTSGGSDDGPYTNDGAAVTDAGEATLSATVGYEGGATDGRTITVEHVDTVGGGFIAVHDSSLLAGEVLGSVVGVSDKLAPGPHEDVEITLDEPVHDSATLIPMPHKDTDGDDTYDFITSEGSEDGPYTDGEGGAVVDTARAVVLGTVTISDQDSTGTVTVDRSTMHDGGFVTIHDASLLDGAVLDSVIGVSTALDPGSHEDIEVALDSVPEGEVTLIAMPHKDTDDDGTYDFVTSEGSEDGPYVANGAVVDTASVTFPTESSGGDGGTDGGDGGTDDAPGVGVGAALAALAGLALLARGRRD